jgi:hypothetical protein
MATLRTYASRLLELVPPWLSRENGERVLGGIADYLDARKQLLSEAVQARFPKASAEDALAYIGRDRRIRRGPLEPAAIYAARLPRWWDAHRARGSAGELLRQLHAYLRDYGPDQIDHVAQSGLRHRIDAAGVVTRDHISWGGDGMAAGPWVDILINSGPPTYPELELGVENAADNFPAEGRYSIEVRGTGSSTYHEETVLGVRVAPREAGPQLVVHLDPSTPLVNDYYGGTAEARLAFKYWARVWIFVHLGDVVPEELLTEDDDELLTEDDDELLGDVSPLSGYTPADDPIWTAIPREWSAAHIQRIRIVLLTGEQRLWGYPVPVPTYGDWAPTTYGASAPILITLEDPL